MHFKKEICIFYLKFNLAFRHAEPSSNPLLSEWRLIFIQSKGKDCLSSQIQSMLRYLKFWKILISSFNYNCEGTSTIDLSGGDEQLSGIKKYMKNTGKCSWHGLEPASCKPLHNILTSFLYPITKQVKRKRD